MSRSNSCFFFCDKQLKRKRIWQFFGNGKTTVAKATFAERLSNVKAMFQTAHNQASALNDEMQKEIETKQAQIESINTQIRRLVLLRKRLRDLCPT